MFVANGGVLTVSRGSGFSLARSRVCLFVFLACLTLGSVGPTEATAAATTSDDDGAVLPRVTARFAIHDVYDRLVFKLPPPASVAYRQNGASLVLNFMRSGDLTANAVSGRRILAMHYDRSGATVQLGVNTRVRTWRENDLLVFDVFDTETPTIQAVQGNLGHSVQPKLSASAGLNTEMPKKVAPSPAFSSNAVAHSQAKLVTNLPSKERTKKIRAISDPATQAKDVRMEAPSPTRQASSLSTSKGSLTTIEPKIVAPTQSAVGRPVSITVLRETGIEQPTILVPFGRDVGAAAFARGGEARVVFDATQSFDLSGLKDDPNFSSVTEQLLPDGVQLRLRLENGLGLQTKRRDDGWLVSIQPLASSTQLAPIFGQNRNGITVFDINAAGHVVIVADELTGGRLLVGTQRTQGQHIGSVHISAEAAVLPSWQGIVVQPISDRVLLRATQAGFELLSMNSPPLAMTWSDQQMGAWPDGHTMTRLFDFAGGSQEALHRLLGQALRDAAATPKLARFGPRLGVAQAMLAQGMDVEAASVLRTAEADDPAGHDRRCAKCLTALASWMSARAGGVKTPDTSFDDAVFGDSDEAALLKALLRPNSSNLAGQAAVVASTWPLLVSYPPSLRRFMLQPVADLLMRGGQHKALSAFLAAFPDASLDLSRADLLRFQGKIDESLKVYDHVAGGRDRLQRANALEQAALTRIAFKHMPPASAAEALNGQLYAWRDGERELRIRQRIAKLRADAGLWRSALVMLNETDEKFPQSHAEIHAAKANLVADLLKGDSVAKLSAIDLVAIADATSDVLDSRDVSFAPALIDKLLALDLAARADPILRRLFQNAKDPKTKAELGVRLAETMLDGDDAGAALAVLAASDDADLGTALVGRRTLLRARLLSRSRKPADALEVLGTLHTPEASSLEATIMEGQHNWLKAVGVMKPVVFSADFATKPPSLQRDLILRLARDEAEAGDQDGLHVLRQTQAAQFQTGPNAALFSVLTAEPVRSTADLPRSATEVKALQALPAAIAKARPF